MDEQTLIGLYWERSQEAIAQTDRMYGPLCRKIAGKFLHHAEDVEECVNDTYFALWNAIPPARPAHFPSFLAKVARNQALKRLEQLTAAKRNTEADLSFEELSQCLGTASSSEEQLDELALRQAITAFLQQQTKENRIIFIRRYFFVDSIQEVAAHCGISRSKVKSSLLRTRQKLKHYLIQEGFFV